MSRPASGGVSQDSLEMSPPESEDAACDSCGTLLASPFQGACGRAAYLDAKRILPDKVAKEIEQVVSRLVNVEYREAQRARHARQPAGCRRPRHRARSPERAERSAPRGNESAARCRRRWAAGAATEAPVTVSDNAAASMRLTVRRINELVRKLSARKHVMDLDG